MKTIVKFNEQELAADMTNPIDISIPTNTEDSAVAWFVSKMKISPVINDRFIGSVKDGGDVNFRNIFFNPHGNCTHTESVGHISEKVYSVNNVLEKNHFIAQLITVNPVLLIDDLSVAAISRHNRYRPQKARQDTVQGNGHSATPSTCYGD